MRWMMRIVKGFLVLGVLLAVAMTALTLYVRTQFGLALGTCAELSEVSPHYSPPGLLAGARECLVAGRTEDAVRLYMLSGIYGRYDMQRVVDRSAHQVIPAMMTTTFAGLEQARSDAFQEAVAQRDVDVPAHQRDCRVIRRIGPPAYRPTYMTAHGLGNFTGDDDNGQALVSDFDSAAAWEKALTGWGRCPAEEGSKQ